MTHRKIGVRSIAIQGGNKNGEIPLLAPLDPFPPPLEFPPRSNSKRSPRSVTNRVFFCDTRQRCTGDPLAAWRSPRASPESSLSFLSSFPSSREENWPMDGSLRCTRDANNLSVPSFLLRFQRRSVSFDARLRGSRLLFLSFRNLRTPMFDAQFSPDF